MAYEARKKIGDILRSGVISISADRKEYISSLETMAVAGKIPYNKRSVEIAADILSSDARESRSPEGFVPGDKEIYEALFRGAKEERIRISPEQMVESIISRSCENAYAAKEHTVKALELLKIVGSKVKTNDPRLLGSAVAHMVVEGLSQREAAQLGFTTETSVRCVSKEIKRHLPEYKK